MKHAIIVKRLNIRTVCCLATLIFFSAVTLFSCQRHFPLPVLPKIKIASPIAVLAFKGPQPYAGELTSNIEALIVNSKWQGKNTYKVVDRSHVNKVIRELKFANSSWLVNPQHAVRAGKLMGARTVIVGKVIRAQINDTSFKGKQWTCLEWKKDADILDKIIERKSKCKHGQTEEVPCVKRQGDFSFSYKVIDVQTSRIIYKKTIRELSKETKQCNSDGNIQNETDAITEAMIRAVDTIGPDLSVHNIKATIKTTSKDPNISKILSLTKEFFKKDIQLWDKACPIWEAGYQQYPSAYELAYNLGLCAEVNGNIKKASYYYREAYDNMSCVDKNVIAAIERMKCNMAK